MDEAQQVTIREPVPADAEPLGRVHAQAWREAYGHVMPASVFGGDFEERRIAIWTRHLERRAAGEARIRVAIAVAGDGRVLGFAGFGPADGENSPREQELHMIYLLREAYGTGLGQRLLDTVDPDRPPAYLWVLKDNPRAVAFYRRNGYTPDGTEQSLEGLIGETGRDLRELRMVR